MSAEDTKHQKVDSTEIPADPRAPYPNLQILIPSVHSLSSLAPLQGLDIWELSSRGGGGGGGVHSIKAPQRPSACSKAP